MSARASRVTPPSIKRKNNNKSGKPQTPNPKWQINFSGTAFFILRYFNAEYRIQNAEQRTQNVVEYPCGKRP
jgi:hypothetical protein